MLKIGIMLALTGIIGLFVLLGIGAFKISIIAGLVYTFFMMVAVGIIIVATEDDDIMWYL